MKTSETTPFRTLMAMPTCADHKSLRQVEEFDGSRDAGLPPSKSEGVSVAQ